VFLKNIKKIQIVIPFLYICFKPFNMTEIGKFLSKKSVNKAEISRRTGISASRLSELSLKESVRLTAEELYLIALAIDTEPSDILLEVCKNIKLEGKND